jgi:uncharacterized protein YndB with AHSA1/START domain
VASGEAQPTAEIEATALVHSPPERVFEFLSELGNHWRVADPFVEVLTLDASDGGAPNGGTVQVRGPLGLRRTATTKVVAARAPRLLIGTAELSGGTRARVSWTLAGRLGSTRVRLAAELDQATPLDRALLALGGRRWLARRFAGTLERLGSELERSVAPVDRAGDDHVAAQRTA